MSKNTVLTFDLYSEPLRFKEIVLKAMNYSCSKRYGRDFLSKSQCDFNFLVSEFSNQVTLQFKGIVYGSKIVTENLLEVPDGKIANLKSALFPKWLLKKFPPKTKVIAQNITVYNSYPDIPIKEDYLTYRHVVQ